MCSVREGVVDKILLTAFLTALAGFITAALSIVKLVNEKESKTTEFRQAWTESARAALADLIAKINSHAHAVVNFRNVQKNLRATVDVGGKVNSEYEKEVHKGLLDFQYDFLNKSFEQSSALAREVYQAHAKVRLHFKPEDPDFVRIENKFDFCMNKLSDIRREEDHEKWAVLKEEIHSATNEITASSRALLKGEWEKVKLGEPAYKSTKKWSVWFCVGMFIVLVTIGSHAIISYVKTPTSHEVSSQTETK
jgi:hypothetical protein